jgi:hypothetical protein
MRLGAGRSFRSVFADAGGSPELAYGLSRASRVRR